MAANPRNLTNPVQFKINISEALRDKLAASADEAHRSISSEMVYRLEKSFEGLQSLPEEPEASPVAVDSYSALEGVMASQRQPSRSEDATEQRLDRLEEDLRFVREVLQKMAEAKPMSLAEKVGLRKKK